VFNKREKKMKIYKPKTIKEAIDDCQEFLECDLYTRFRPAQTLPIGKKGKDKTWIVILKMFLKVKEIF